MYVCSYKQDFFSDAWVMPQGWDLGMPVCQEGGGADGGGGGGGGGG